MKSRSEYIEAALEAYSQFANKKATEYVEKNVLPRMEKMIYSLENRIGRQMFNMMIPKRQWTFTRVNRRSFGHCDHILLSMEAGI